MAEHISNNIEFKQAPEHVATAEYNVLPEYTPVYPDINFFQESAVTAREENIFMGEVPPGEPARDLKEERKKKRSRFNILKQLLSVASRGGVIALAAVVILAVFSLNAEEPMSELTKKLSSAFGRGKKAAFTQTKGYSPEQFARLWEKDPDAPHAYDYNNPIIYYPSGCVEEGEIELICLECGVHRHDIIPANGHTPGTPVKENESGTVDCTHGAYYENVVYCDVCGIELSRDKVNIPANGHTAGTPVRENVTATCTQGGTYSSVTYCTVCGAEISRVNTESDPLGHDIATRRENTTAATCTAAGSYQEVQYCTRCGEIIARNTVTLPMIGHIAGDPVEEVIREATCAEEGEGERITYCSVCGAEISRERYTIAMTGHTAGQPSEVVMREATCSEEGEAVLVTYCSVCGDELERGEPYILAKTDHTPADPVEENVVAATCTSEGHGESVVYCSVCGEELERSAYVELMLEHNYSVSYDWNIPSEIEYHWEVDEEEVLCTATGVCTRCGDEISETSLAEGEEIQANTCTQEGIYTYTAYFVNDEFTTEVYEVRSAATGHVEGNLQTENVKEATCEEPGSYDVVAYCAVCGQEMERQTNETDPALGHDWGDPAYVWADDYSSCTATVTCSRDASHTQTAESTSVNEDVLRAATCEDEGITRYMAEFGDEATFRIADTSVTVPATGHDWGTASYEWSELDGVWLCHAYRVCNNDENHVDEETAEGSLTVISEVACEANGEYRYTATFQNSAFTSQTHTEYPAAIGHDWNEPTYQDGTDENMNRTITARITCKNDESHGYTETVKAVVETTATCDEPGETTYTYTFENELFTTQVQTESTDALGHDWGEPSYEYAVIEDDVHLCTASAVCSRCGETLSETARASVTVHQEADCEQDGSYTYTYTFQNEIFSVDPQDETVPAYGHYWVVDEYDWAENDDGDMVCYAYAYCEINEDHTIEEEVVAAKTITKQPTCEEDGTADYTATFEHSDVFETQTREDVTIPALGHEYGTPTYEWTQEDDDMVCKATATCSVCGQTEIEFSYAIRTDYTAPTCDEEGSGTYEASFDQDIFTTQTKTFTLDATGHDWEIDDYYWEENDDGDMVCYASAWCRNDETHTVEEEVTAVITDNTATCDEGGVITYTATFEHSDIFESQTRTIQTGPLGHDYDITYEWITMDAGNNMQGEGCRATAVCSRCGDTVTEDALGSLEIVDDPTCEEGGSGELIATFTKEPFEEQSKTVTLDALGHDWVIDDYDWAESDNGDMVCYASAWCRNDESHTRAEDVVAEILSTTATCEEGGMATYQATFTKEPFETQTLRTQTGPLGHDYTVSYDWKEVTNDNGWNEWTCTATAVCSRDSSHTITESGSITYDYLTEATPTEHGTIELTAEFRNDAFTTQTKTVEDHYYENYRVIENRSAACGEQGTYDTVMYCPVCGAEIMREEGIETDRIPHDFGLQDEKGAPVIPSDYTDLTCSLCGEHAFSLELYTDEDTGETGVRLYNNFSESAYEAGMYISSIKVIRTDDDLTEPQYAYWMPDYEAGNDGTISQRLSEFWEGNNGEEPESGDVYRAYITITVNEWFVEQDDTYEPPTFILQTNTITIP